MDTLKRAAIISGMGNADWTNHGCFDHDYSDLIQIEDVDLNKFHPIEQ